MHAHAPIALHAKPHRLQAMSKPSAPMDVEPPDELAVELLVLKAVQGVDRVYQYPKGKVDTKKQNNNRVMC